MCIAIFTATHPDIALSVLSQNVPDIRTQNRLSRCGGGLWPRAWPCCRWNPRIPIPGCRARRSATSCAPVSRDCSRTASSNRSRRNRSSCSIPRTSRRPARSSTDPLRSALWLPPVTRRHVLGTSCSVCPGWFLIIMSLPGTIRRGVAIGPTTFWSWWWRPTPIAPTRWTERKPTATVTTTTTR